MRLIITFILCLWVIPAYALDIEPFFGETNGSAKEVKSYQGQLIAYWKRYGVNPQDKAIAFVFYPKHTNYDYIDLSLKQFGYTAIGRYQATEPNNKLTLEERAVLNLQLAEKYFGPLPKEFLEKKEGVLAREGEVSINYLTKDRACDHLWLYAHLVNFKATATVTTLPLKAGPTSCASETWFVEQDIYIIESKDGHANLREQPSLTAKVTTKLNNGTQLSKLLTVTNGWYLMIPVESFDLEEELVGQALYVHSSQLKMYPYYNDKVKYFVRGIIREALGAYYTSDGAIIYTEPRMESKPLIEHKISPYTAIESVEQIQSVGWYKVKVLLAGKSYIGYMQREEVEFNAVGEVANNHQAVILYTEPTNNAKQLVSLQQQIKIQITLAKQTTNKDWFYVEILDHQPAYKGYLKRQDIDFY